MSKHTPGPWVARNSGPHWNNKKISNWTVHYGDNEEHIVDHVYEESDARLIAQAPRLLEALKGLDEAYCRALMPLTKQERQEDRMRLIEARAAIAAAAKETSHGDK